MQLMISLSKYWCTTRLIARCSRRPADERAWHEFVRRFHITIQQRVERTFTIKATGVESSVQLDDQIRDYLVQAVYRKLVEDQSRLLREFVTERPGSFKAFLAILSVN